MQASKMKKLYYIAPVDSIFGEVRSEAIKIWNQYDNHEAHIEHLKEMQNIKDNMMYILAEFDEENQEILFNRMSDETQIAISDRVKSVNSTDIITKYYQHIIL